MHSHSATTRRVSSDFFPASKARSHTEREWKKQHPIMNLSSVIAQERWLLHCALEAKLGKSQV